METDKSIGLEKIILQHVQEPNFKDMNRVRLNEFNVTVAVELEIGHDLGRTELKKHETRSDNMSRKLQLT